MRLTRFTDYGLRALMLMAAEPDRGLSTAELAGRLELSRNHLAKIIQRLVQGGVVVTRRGGGGGATLAAAPETVRLGRIVRLLEEDQPLVECMQDPPGACSLLPGCRLKTRLRHAEAAFLSDLDHATLADIAKGA